MTFDAAPQGAVRMRAIDNQMVVPSYLMRVREGWTGVNDMFEEVQSFESVEPLDARCDLPL
jgi:urea transport system substrate-binding protein